MQRALFVHMSRSVPLLRALLDTGAVTASALDEELARSELPSVRTVVPILRLLEALPAGICTALLAAPIRLDARTGTVDVATADPFDQHVGREFGFHLRAPIRLIRAPLAALDDAFRKLDQTEDAAQTRERDRPSSIPAPPRLSRRTPPYLSRPDLEAMMAPQLGVPQLRRPTSDLPIPLVRRTGNDAHAMDDGQRRVPTVRPPGPFASNAPVGPYPDAGPLIDAIRASRSRDEIIDLLINGLAMVAGRVGLFVVRRSEFHGWRCNEAMADLTAFREVHIALEQPSLLATAAATGFYLGPIPRTRTHAHLIQVMGGMTTNEVAATPVRVEGKLAMLLFLDELGDTMIATRRAEDLGRIAGEALGRIVQRDKQS